MKWFKQLVTFFGKRKSLKLFIVRRVVGGSMEPTLVDGMIVLALRLPIRQHDVVIAHQAKREVIKRVVKKTTNAVELRGDNAAMSSDSRTYGAVKCHEVIARAVVAISRWKITRL